MGAVIDQFNRAFRDFNTEGVAASGLAEVDKADARAIGPLIEQAVATVGLGPLVSARFTTLAAANASLAYPDGAVAIVFADATAANNDFVVKVGASGTGNWAPSGIIPGIFSAAGGPLVAQAAASAGSAAASAASILGIIARVTKYPGWLMAIKGAARKLVWGIKDDGTEWAYLSERATLKITTLLNVLGFLRIGSLVTTAKMAYGSTVYAVADSMRRQLVALLGDGTVWAYKAQAVQMTAGNLRTGSSAVTNASWIVYTQADASGNFQVYKQSRATGTVTALTTSGNHTDLHINGSVVTWITNGSYSENVDLDAGTSQLILPNKTLVAIGHSMLANYSSDRQPPLPERIGSRLGWPVMNFAIPAQNVKQQQARMGLVATTVTVQGNTIPASGYVNVTALTPNDFAAQAYGPTAINGWLAGVYGALSWDGTLGERFLRATPGDAVSISAGATWVPDIGNAFNGVGLLWMLVNSALNVQADLDQALADLTTVFNAFKPLGKRIVILKEFPRLNETLGTPARTLRDQLNAMVQAAYPNNFLDLMPALYAAAQSSDASAIAQGLAPPSLTVDGFHCNNAGNAINDLTISTFITTKGWL